MATQGNYTEIEDYQRKYVHIAPEVINGEHIQSIRTVTCFGLMEYSIV